MKRIKTVLVENILKKQQACCYSNGKTKEIKDGEYLVFNDVAKTREQVVGLDAKHSNRYLQTRE